jgi:hypothetical protein
LLIGACTCFSILLVELHAAVPGLRFRV